MWRSPKNTFAALIESVSSALEAHGRLPKNCELSAIGPLQMAALYDEFDPSRLMADYGFCGMDADQDLAILKALVECAERAAFREGFVHGDPLCLTERSDGFAAFPVGKAGARAAALDARANALAEAVERFVWATWADNDAIGFSQSLAKHEVLDEIDRLIPLTRTFLIKPKFDFESLELQIYFAELQGGGVVSGGACGKIGDENTSLRALSELARHASAIRKMREENAQPAGIYERRLAYLASTEGAAHLHRRLSQTGVQAVTFPRLALDGSVTHALSATVAVHRCLFENQPPFVAGAVERLCL